MFGVIIVASYNATYILEPVSGVLKTKEYCLSLIESESESESETNFDALCKSCNAHCFTHA